MYLLSEVLIITKHSSRLILKISCFTINASELVNCETRYGLFLGFMSNVDLTIALLVIVSSKKCSFNSSSGYSIAICSSVALLAIVLHFLC